MEKKLSTGLPISATMRQTAWLCEIEGIFYIRAVHASVPSSQQKAAGYYPIQFGEHTLEQRRMAFDSRSISLVNDTMPGESWDVIRNRAFLASGCIHPDNVDKYTALYEKPHRGKKAPAL